MASATANVDPGEIDRFSALAASWWDPDGPMRPLHRLNPVRVGYARDRLVAHFALDAQLLRPLAGLRIADVGCGAGLLCEPLARLGAHVIGIDAAADSLDVARRHAEQAGLQIDYRCATAEALAAAGERFDAVIAMEVVEHVPDLDAFLAACARLAAPGGAVILSTLNRTLRSFLLGIVAAEYVLRWVPAGTHRWDRFVRPAELRRGLAAGGVRLTEVRGLSYDMGGGWRLSGDAAVNYLAFGVRAPA